MPCDPDRALTLRITFTALLKTLQKTFHQGIITVANKVKRITVAQSRPIAATLPATKNVEKGRRRCFELKSPESAVEDMTFEHQSNNRKQKARAIHLNSATAVQRQTRRTRNQTKEAIKEELRCIADLKLYAAYLAVESGAWLEQPWIKKLIDVSNRKLDPHELLKTYRGDPDSVRIADRKTPNHYWMPTEAEGTVPLQSMSRCAAMRALLGKQNWRESPALQAARERSKHIVLPPNPPRPEDDLEGYIAYIAGAERLAYLKGRSKNVWHQGCAAAMEI